MVISVVGGTYRGLAPATASGSSRVVPAGGFSLVGLHADVDGLRTLRPLFGLIGDLGALVQRAVAAGPGDRAVVDEQVLRHSVGCDEAKALVVAEPLHGSGSHYFLRR